MSRWPSTFEDLDIALARGIISFFSISLRANTSRRPSSHEDLDVARSGKEEKKKTNVFLELSSTGVETQKCSTAQVRPDVFYLGRLGVAQ